MLKDPKRNRAGSNFWVSWLAELAQDKKENKNLRDKVIQRYKLHYFD